MWIQVIMIDIQQMFAVAELQINIAVLKAVMKILGILFI